MATTNSKPTEAEDKPVLSERTRSDLAQFGYAQSPFTGALLVGTPDNYREVDQDEHDRVAKESAKRRTAKKASNLL